MAFFSNQDKKEKFGTLRYYGRPEFAAGVWCGVELDRPEGKNNGSKHGIRYFTCGPAYGVFVPVERVQIDSTRRCRSRPNSRPNSRPSSAERARKIESNDGTRLRPAAVQQELARLAQQVPVTDHLTRRKTASNSVTNSRQPLKAFARSKDDGIIANHNAKQSAVPFRGRCIQRAASSENLRKLNVNGSKCVKKSSSERDLKAGNTLPRSTKSSKRCCRPQSVLSGDKDLNQHWPRTSTPKTGDVVDGSSSSSPDPEHTPSTANCEFVPMVGSGLSTHAKQLVELERNSSAGTCRVASPDPGKNKVTHYVAHPLSQATELDPTPQTIKDLLTELITQNREIIERQGMLWILSVCLIITSA